MSNATLTKKTATPAERFAAMPTDHAGLAAMYAPRVIRKAADAKRATAIIADLVGFDLSADQEDYVGLLARLNDEWARSQPDARKRAAPVELVRLMMAEHEMTQTQMGEVLGVTKGGMSMILSGERELSKASIRRFCDRFKIGVDAMF